jgi:nitrate/nitrite transporter NarK
VITTNTTLGLAAGVALGFAGAFGGFGAFLVVLVLGALGLLVGRWADGRLDLTELTEQLRGAGSDRDRIRR